ncbi:fasciclin domain-containing protein, partial [Mesorhizobium sp. M1C.F.Ca.ET.187.01.1.1]
GAEMMKKVKAMGGKYEMKTVSGDTLTAEVKKGKLYIMDESGGESKVTIADVNQSNGVIHVVNKVLLPK